MDALAQPHVQSSISFSYYTNSTSRHVSDENVICPVTNKIITELKYGKKSGPVYALPLFFVNCQ